MWDCSFYWGGHVSVNRRIRNNCDDILTSAFYLFPIHYAEITSLIYYQYRQKNNTEDHLLFTVCLLLTPVDSLQSHEKTSKDLNTSHAERMQVMLLWTFYLYHCQHLWSLRFKLFLFLSSKTCHSFTDAHRRF